RFARAMLQRWMSKESSHLRDAVAAWLADQWSQRQLEPDPIVQRLRESVRATLSGEPETVFDALTTGLGFPGGAAVARVDAAAARGIRDKLRLLVGRPHAEGQDAIPGRLLEVLNTTARTVIAECEGGLSEMAVYFLEQPSFRIAGAEEVIRQI